MSDSPATRRRLARRLPAEDLAWLGLVPATLILLAALYWAAPTLSELLPEPTYPFYPDWEPPKNHPEPVETTRFMLAVAMPLALAAIVLALGSRQPARRSLDPAVIAVALAGMAFVAVTVHAERRAAYFDFHVFDTYLLPPANLIAAPLIGLALTVAALSWNGPRLTRLRQLGGRLTGRAWPATVVAIALTAVWMLPAVITDANLFTNGLIPSAHVPIEFDEFVAVSNGRTPLVDYVPWYGSLLPIALSPLWPLFDWSITSFTVAMTLISVAALTAVYAGFRQLTGGAWSALALYLPFMAGTLQPWTTDGAVREFNGSYFAILPERYLGPFVLFWLCARHLRRGSPPVWAVFLIAGLSFLNNPDFGAACLVALIPALIVGAERDLPLRSWIADRAPQALAGLLGAVLAFVAVILVRSGELPDLDLFAYPTRLTRQGYTLSPIPTELGFQWALYVTYVGALLAGTVRYVRRAPDRALTGMLVFAGVFGLATASYFAGRSFHWQLWGLFGAWALALALLAWTAWLALRSSGRDSGRRLAVTAFAALAGFGVMVAAIDRFPVPWQQLNRIADSGEPRFDNYDQQRFIEERTEPGERVLILGWELDHRLAERAGVVNVSPWFGVQALLGPNETGRALDQLAEEGGDAVFLRIARPDFITYDEGINRQVATMMRERGYVPVARDAASGTVEWRPREAAQRPPRLVSRSS